MAGYGDDAGFQSWMDANGLVLPAGSPSSDALRERGSTYIDSVYGPRFVGHPTGGYAQERAWPRTDASAYGQPIPPDEIPVPVIESAYFAAFQEGANPGSLSVSTTGGGGKIKRERVEGAVEVEYFENKSSSASSIGIATPLFGYIEGKLYPFLDAAKAGYALGAVAVV